MSLYAIHMAVKVALVQTIAAMVESIPEKDIRVGISLAAIVVNFHATRWEFYRTVEIQDNYWKSVIFNTISIFTEILSLYSTFSMLAPKWLPWYGFVIICVVTTLIRGRDKLRLVFIWSYQKALAMKMYVIEKFSMLPTDATV